MLGSCDKNNIACRENCVRTNMYFKISKKWSNRDDKNSIFTEMIKFRLKINDIFYFSDFVSLMLIIEYKRQDKIKN